MDLSFDLQLFAAKETDVKNIHLTDGLELSGTTFTIGNTSLSVYGSKTVTTSSWVGFNYSTGTGKNTSFTANYLAPSGSHTAPNASKALVAFTGGDADWSTIQASGSNMSLAINDTGKYTWKFAAENFNRVTLGGSQQKIELSNFIDGMSFYSNDTAKNSIKFTNYDKTKNIRISDKVSLKSGFLGLENNSGAFSLVSGTSLAKDLIITGNGTDVLSLKSSATAPGASSILNFKSDGTGQVVLTAMSVQSDINNMKKVTMKLMNGDINLTTVKSSTVVLDEQADDLNIVIGGVDSNSSVTLGGKTGKVAGSHHVSLSGSGRETFVLDSVGTAADYTAYKWLESTGDTTKGNTISLYGSIADFTVSTVGDGYAKVAANSTATASSFMSGETNSYKKLGVNITASEGTYSALLVGNSSLQAAANTNFSKYNYIIGDSNKTLDLGDTNKKIVFLNNGVGEGNWGENAAYKDITAVKTSSVGKTMLISEMDKAASLNAAGSNDSVWGGGNGIGDTIKTSDAKSINVYSGANDGLDTLESYSFGTSKSKANAVRFLDGVSYIAAGANNFTVGADAKNAMYVSLSGATEGDKVAYGFGTEGDKYVAAVDATTNGQGVLTYESDVNAYFGQGDGSSVSITSSAGAARIGWDGGAGAVSIGALNGKTAKDGSVLVGTTDMAQSIVGSDIGASSISGGFVRDEWTDVNNDTLIGGAKATTFFVGGKMGNDEITGLTSNDNIVFLGSKYADCTKSDDTTSLSFTFSGEAGGARITAETANSANMSTLKNVSLYFDDTTLVWDGKTWNEK